MSHFKKHGPLLWTILTLSTVLVICAIFDGFFQLNILRFFQELLYLNYLPKLSSNAGFWLILFFGLLSSFHCIGMCGGIILTQCLKCKLPQSSASGDPASPDGHPTTLIAPFRPAVFYNTGRVISYTTVGGIVGGIGQVLALTDLLRGLIPILGGLYMLVMAITLLDIFPTLRRINYIVPKFFAKKLLHGDVQGPLRIGLLTGLMPCGPLQIMQVYALGTKSTLYGAAAMLIFALGTIPGLFAFGALGTLLTKRFRDGLMKGSALLVAILGCVMILQGLSLEGVSTSFLPTTDTAGGYTLSVLSGNVQRVTTEITESKFPAIQVTQGIKVLWTIKVTEANYNGCNQELLLPEYHIDKKLAVGDNLVEFMPDKTGEFPYTCWMGMIKSRIRVVATPPL